MLTYNNKTEHPAIEMTPKEAMKQKSELKAKQNMTRQATRTRKSPEISIGDKVRIYRKRKVGENERTSMWKPEIEEVERIEQNIIKACFTYREISACICCLNFKIFKIYIELFITKIFSNHVLRKHKGIVLYISYYMTKLIESNVRKLNKMKQDKMNASSKITQETKNRLTKVAALYKDRKY